LDDGRVEIYDDEKMELKQGKKFAQEEVDTVVFSPDGKLLAAASWDQTIYVIDVATFKAIALKGHTSSVEHITFSADSKTLASNSKDYEILYWNAATGKRVDEGSVVDTEWSNWANILGWPVVVVFQKGNDGTDVNCVTVSGDHKSDYRVIASGDDSQLVHLFRYPALHQNWPTKEFVAHSSHVTRVRFTPDSSLLFSLGGLDQTLMQWRHIPIPAPAAE